MKNTLLHKNECNTNGCMKGSKLWVEILVNETVFKSIKLNLDIMLCVRVSSITRCHPKTCLLYTSNVLKSITFILSEKLSKLFNRCKARRGNYGITNGV